MNSLAKIKKIQKERNQFLSNLENHIFNIGILADEFSPISPTKIEEDLEKYGKTGYYPGAIGEVMSSRYVLLERIGKGNNSSVWLARDVKNKEVVVIKIKNNSKNLLETSLYEMEVFQTMMKQARLGEWAKDFSKLANKSLKPGARPPTYVVKLLNAFYHETRLDLYFCMVFEVLDCSLRTIIDRYEQKGIPLVLARKITKQLLIGVHFLHKHCNIIHNNLTPENIMFNFSKEKLIEINRLRETSDENLRLSVIRKIVKEINRTPNLSDKGKISQPIAKGIAQLQNLFLEKNEKFIYRMRSNQSIDSFEMIESENIKPENREFQIEAGQREEGYVLTEEQFKLEFERLAKENNLTTKKELKNLKRKLKKKMKKYIYKISGFPKSDVSLRLINGNTRNRKYIPRDVKNRKLDLESANLPSNFRIRLIDLANCCWVNGQVTNYNTTKYYKPPEGILGMAYTPACDIWTIGCIVFEILTGEKLFDPKMNKNLTQYEDHLSMIIELLNGFPANFAMSGSASKRYFNSKGNLRKPVNLNYLGIKDTLVKIHNVREDEAEAFADFLKKMLVVSPQKRASAQELLAHEWLSRETTEFFATPEEIAKNPIIYALTEDKHPRIHEIVDDQEFDADNSYSSSEIEEINEEDRFFYGSFESKTNFFDHSFKHTFVYTDSLENRKLDNTDLCLNDKIY